MRTCTEGEAQKNSMCVRWKGFVHTHEWVMSRAYSWVMLGMIMIYVALNVNCVYMNDACVCVCVCVCVMCVWVCLVCVCVYVCWHEWWVMLRRERSYATHMEESCHTYERVMSLSYERVVSQLSVSHVTRMNQSCYTHEPVKSHIWISRVTHVSHVTHMNESSHTYEWVMSHILKCHVASHKAFNSAYGVATISRLLKIVGLFCKRAI